jgi:hypothetical protein
MRLLRNVIVPILFGAMFLSFGSEQQGYAQELSSFVRIQEPAQSIQVKAESTPTGVQEKQATGSELSALLKVRTSDSTAPTRIEGAQEKPKALDISAKDEKLILKLFTKNGRWIDLTWQTDPAQQNELAPVTYEWARAGKSKQPYCFEVSDGELFAFAGLWDRWKDPSGNWITTCSILTTAPNAVTSLVHDRMPVILDPHS